MAVHERGQLEGISHQQLAAKAGLPNVGVAWQRRDVGDVRTGVRRMQTWLTAEADLMGDGA